jgi:predicted glycogen debranching enzyme
MNDVLTRPPQENLTEADFRHMTETEWLVTNGLGGYASGTLSGALTRVFHGYLIAALPSPLGRTMMLNDILEEVVFPDGTCIALNGLFTQDTAGQSVWEAGRYLTQCTLQSGLPVWSYEVNGISFERRLVLPHTQNTTYLSYKMTYGSGPVKLRLRPCVNMRPHEAPVDTPTGSYKFSVQSDLYEIHRQGAAEYPPLRLSVSGNECSFAMDTRDIKGVTYGIERSRGYIWHGDLWSPGCFLVTLDSDSWSTLTASTESWEVIGALTPQQAWNAEVDRKRRLLREAHPQACDESCRELIWAADQFIFEPVGRPEDATRAHAAGDELRSVIAGYHWFTDWGRDTMISLEGLTLITGRYFEANYILRTFAHYIKDGLIPNMFPEGRVEGLYHTADATLWFFHAFHRYYQYTHDRHLLEHLLPSLLDIVKHHLEGTRFNIHVDLADGLVVQGQAGYQLTWMDAKVDDWVVTPRRGKAVEINALWYNALRLLERWLRDADRHSDAEAIAQHADQAKMSFNRKFWNAERGFLFDVVDGENPPADAYCRPNQIFALALEYPILSEEYWHPVVTVVKERLLTPVGLRSLAPGEAEYKPCYDGDLRSRDAAYHQGTVWGWLIGPFIDAWLRVYPEEAPAARGFLSGFRDHLSRTCAGTISEIFDAEAPFAPRGCCAQAWSVAEVLRSYVTVATAMSARGSGSDLLSQSLEVATLDVGNSAA